MRLGAYSAGRGFGGCGSDRDGWRGRVHGRTRRRFPHCGRCEWACTLSHLYGWRDGRWGGDVPCARSPMRRGPVRRSDNLSPQPHRPQRSGGRVRDSAQMARGYQPACRRRLPIMRHTRLGALGLVQIARTPPRRFSSDVCHRSIRGITRVCGVDAQCPALGHVKASSRLARAKSVSIDRGAHQRVLGFASRLPAIRPAIHQTESPITTPTYPSIA